MAIYGNVVGGSGGALGKTLILEDPSGIELVGVVTESEQVLDAGPKDIMLGKTACTSNGITVGEREFLAYRTIQSDQLIFPGEKFLIPLSHNDQYDYTKFQCIISKFNTTFSDSLYTDKIAINDCVIGVNSTEILSYITKDSDNQSIDLGIINDTEDLYVIHFFTYKEEQL